MKNEFPSRHNGREISLQAGKLYRCKLRSNKRESRERDMVKTEHVDGKLVSIHRLDLVFHTKQSSEEKQTSGRPGSGLPYRRNKKIISIARRETLNYRNSVPGYRSKNR
jgi:hypothetical protein